MSYEGIAYASPRIAPILAGVGLLDAVSDQEILRREDPFDSDGDGISGRANWVWDELTNQVVIGRFGWKANQPNLEQQTALAYQLDLGMTSPMFPQHDCGDAQESCDDSSTTPELNSEDVTLVAEYLRGLSLPPRNNYEDPEAYIGMQLFREANCQACHVPNQTKPITCNEKPFTCNATFTTSTEETTPNKLHVNETNYM